MLSTCWLEGVSYLHDSYWLAVHTFFPSSSCIFPVPGEWTNYYFLPLLASQVLLFCFEALYKSACVYQQSPQVLLLLSATFTVPLAHPWDSPSLNPHCFLAPGLCTRHWHWLYPFNTPHVPSFVTPPTHTPVLLLPTHLKKCFGFIYFLFSYWSNLDW